MRSAARRDMEQEKAQRMIGLLNDLLAVSSGVVGCVLRLSTTTAFDADLARRFGPDFFDVISDTASEILSDMIDEPNFFFKTSPMSFVVIFVSLDAAQAAGFCEQAQVRIVQTLKLKHNVSQVLVDIEIDTLTTEKLRADPRAWSPGGGLEAGDVQRAIAKMERRKAALEDIDLVLRPVRDLRRDDQLVFAARLRRETAPGRFDYGYSVRSRPSDLKTIAYFDSKILEYCEDLIQNRLPADAPYVLAVPLNYPSYKNPRLQPLYQAGLSRMPDATRKRLLIEMVGAADDGLRQSLQWDVAYLARHCRGAILQTRSGARSFSWARSLNVTAIGTSVFGERPIDRRLATRLRAFVQDTEALRLPRFLTGVGEPALIEMARTLGFRFVSGPAVGEDQYIRRINATAAR